MRHYRLELLAYLCLFIQCAGINYRWSVEHIVIRDALPAGERIGGD